MKVERDITGGVCKIPTHDNIFGMRKGRDGGDVEELARVEMDSR
jgi:hypothetical protein